MESELPLKLNRAAAILYILIGISWANPSNRGIRYTIWIFLKSEFVSRHTSLLPYHCVWIPGANIWPNRPRYWTSSLPEQRNWMGWAWLAFGTRAPARIDIFPYIFFQFQQDSRALVHTIDQKCSVYVRVRSNSTFWISVKLLYASGKYEQRKSNCYVHFYWKVFIASLANCVRSLGWWLRDGSAELNLSLRH